MPVSKHVKDPGSAIAVAAYFNDAYAMYAPVLYGIALRIGRDESLAAMMLKEMFVCLGNRGCFAKQHAMCGKRIVSVAFECISGIMKMQVPEDELQTRLMIEGKRLSDRSTDYATNTHIVF